MKKLDDWEVDFDEQDELTACDDIFADDGTGNGQVEFTEDYDTDLLPVDGKIDVNEDFDEIPNPEGSTSEVSRVEHHANREIKIMSDFDDAISKAVSNIPECLAGGIDMPHFPAIRVWSGWRDVLGSLRLISLSKTGWFKPSI